MYICTTDWCCSRLGAENLLQWLMVNTETHYLAKVLRLRDWWVIVPKWDLYIIPFKAQQTAIKKGQEDCKNEKIKRSETLSSETHSLCTHRYTAAGDTWQNLQNIGPCKIPSWMREIPMIHHFFLRSYGQAMIAMV